MKMNLTFPHSLSISITILFPLTWFEVAQEPGIISPWHDLSIWPGLLSVLGGLSGSHILERDFSSFEFNESMLMLLPVGVVFDERGITQHDFANATFDAIFVERRVEVDKALVLSRDGQATTIHDFVTAATAMEASHVRIHSARRRGNAAERQWMKWTNCDLDTHKMR